MESPYRQAAPPQHPGRARWLRPGVLWFAFDMLAPTALIYLLLWLGASLYLALLASGALSALSAVISYWRGTAQQRFAPQMLVLTLVGFGVALLTGSERFLLAKESLLTTLVGCWFLSSLWAARPLTYILTRPLLERRFRSKSRSWELLWTHEPRFRRLWHVSTVMWGTALLIDALLRVVIAYTLPVYVVPALQSGLILATVLLMQVVTNVYYTCAGLWHLLHEAPEQ